MTGSGKGADICELMSSNRGIDVEEGNVLHTLVGHVFYHSLLSFSIFKQKSLDLIKYPISICKG